MLLQIKVIGLETGPFLTCVFFIDLTNYKMFARTVWSDSVLAKALLKIIEAFNLTSVKTLGTKGSDNSRALADDLLTLGKYKNRTVQQCNIVE